MRVAVFGSRGQLGSATVSALTMAGIHAQGFDRSNFHIDDSASKLEDRLRGFDYVVNCLAYTDVDKAEINQELAMAANGLFPGRLAIAASASGCKLIQISTDHVFDGKSVQGYREEDSPNPLNYYGRTKAFGEDLVQKHTDNFLIIRTAWLYSHAESCFPMRIRKLVLSQEQVPVVSDQFGSPTWTGELARTIAEVILRDFASGNVLHLASSDGTSKYAFAREIAYSLDPNLELRITPIATEDFSSLAKRPRDTRLVSTAGVGLDLPDWKSMWLKFLKDLGDQLEINSIK